MEQAIALIFLILTVIVKGMTAMWLAQLQKDVGEAGAEDADALRKLEAVEAQRLQFEQERKVLDREAQLLENEKDLLCMEIRKLGAEPIPESELDAIDAARNRVEPAVGKHEAAPGAAEGETAEGEAAEGETAEGEAAEGEAAAGIDSGPSGGGAGQSREGASRASGSRILVVDDNDELRELLKQALQADYEVVGAVDGYDAFTKILKEKQEFDLIVTDLKMPNISGITLAENLPKDIPIIIISAYLQRPAFKNALKDVSSVGVLEKPFKLSDMRRMIEKALGGRAGSEPAEAEMTPKPVEADLASAPEGPKPGVE